ncbi:glycosyltransferase family 2 protein, partial [Candidatus Woesearchaeota archaeon]|nr:glycosyltransferase family 2 protein [Candidatus Woesearchaeota archaeon]
MATGLLADPIMFMGMIVFFVLFGFLFFVFVVFLIAMAKGRHKYKKHSPAVTVIIPTYNEEAHIGACIDAVRATKYPKMTLLVIDDGSTDKTRDIVKARGVKLVKQNHKGKVEALNNGLRLTKTPVLVTIDADTMVREDFISEIVRPFADKSVGATSGVVLVENRNNIAGIFQNIEYHYNNLIRQSFTRVFDTGIWFFGCLAAYRTATLRELDGFSKDTMTEDMDIAMSCKKAGHKTINVTTAAGYTVVPTTLKKLFLQRSRWWVGGLQSLMKNKKMFSFRSSPSILFLFVNHFWWAFYAFLSLPLIIYQVFYWLPETGVGMYLFRWFTLIGPFYVLYKMPVWGLNFYNIFGVLSGIISVAMIVSAIKLYKDRLTLQNLIAIFLYFPYTIILNLLVA